MNWEETTYQALRFVGMIDLVQHAGISGRDFHERLGCAEDLPGCLVATTTPRGRRCSVVSLPYA